MVSLPAHAVQVLEDAGVQHFPSPYVEGFGWDESGKLIFPDRPEVRPWASVKPGMLLCRSSN